MRILLSILISIAPILGFAQSTGKIVEANGFLGTQSRINYVKNPNAEKNTDGVTVSGTGATVLATISNPFFDTKSFRFGGTLGNTIVGTFAFNNFSPGMVEGGTNCYTSYWMSIDSNGVMTVNQKLAGTVVATQTVDASLSALPKRQYFIYYPCGSFGQAPTLEFSFASTIGTNTNLWNVDEVFGGYYDGPSTLSIRTNPVLYTPTLTNFGTSPSSNLLTWQDGAFQYINGTITCGTTLPASPASVSLPPGLTTPAGIPTLSLRGSWNRGIAATSHGGSILAAPSSTTFGFSDKDVFGAASINPSAIANGNALCANSEVLLVNAIIPIAGASNVLAIPASCINDPACSNNFSAKVSSADAVTDENYSFINGNCTDATTGQATCTFDTSRFSVTPNCTALPVDAGGAISARITAQSASAITVLTFTSTTGAAINAAFNLACSRAGTDVKPWGPIPLLSGLISNDLTTTQRNVTLEFAGAATPSTTCTSNPCTVRNPSLAGITVTWTSTGLQTVNFPANTWRSVDDYTCQPTLTSFAGANGPAIAAVKTSATALTVTCTAAGVVNCAGVVSCWGPR